MAFIRYKGSPDVFDESTGRYISAIEAQKISNFDSQVKQVDVIRPDVKEETDFAKLAGTNITLPTAPAAPVAPAGGTEQPAQGQQTDGTQPQNQNQGTITSNQQQNPATGQPEANAGQLDATIGQAGQVPVQVGGKFGTQNFGRIGENVVEIMSDGSQRPVSEAEFKNTLRAKGLNLEVLPQISPTTTFDSGNPSGLAGSGPDGFSIDGEEKGPANFVSDYTAIIKELGLTSIKEQFNSIQEQYKEIQDKKLDEQLEINDNPWLSEGMRVSRLRKLDEKYAGKESNLTNQMELYNSLYEEGVAQAKFLTSGLQEDRNKLMDLAMRREEAESKMAQQDFENQLKLANLSIAEQKLAIDEYNATKVSGSGVGGLTPTQLFDRELKLAGNFERITADARSARQQLVQMEEGLKQAKAGNMNAGSQAVLVTFQKILDPTSVVRESEYARSGSGLSLIGRLEGAVEKLRKGGAGVKVTDLEDFVTLGREFIAGYERSIIGQAQLIQNQAASIGADLSRVLPPDALSLLNRSFEQVPEKTQNAETDLLEDISYWSSQGLTREQVRDKIKSAYPEFTESQIYQKILKAIPDKPSTTNLFGTVGTNTAPDTTGINKLF